MLIDDLTYFKKRSNYYNKFSGMDNPTESYRTKQEWYAYSIQDFDYQFNSWGFRGPEYEQYIGKKVNICLGDSFTVNVGGPIEHSWCSQLAKHFEIPTLNLGMDGAGNDAIKLVYNRACNIFDVQDAFVMYSYLHRRLNDNEFIQEVISHSNNCQFFLEQRLFHINECALPSWNFTQEEISMFNQLGIYLLETNLDYFFNHQKMDRRFIKKESYNSLRGRDWPTLEEFQQGAEPHKDMLTREFGQFVSDWVYKNRDGHHMNYEANKIYATYLYKKWQQKR